MNKTILAICKIGIWIALIVNIIIVFGLLIILYINWIIVLYMINTGACIFALQYLKSK